jgi:hypothetical protein
MGKRAIYILAFIILINQNIMGQFEFAPIGAEWYYTEILSYSPPEEGFIKLTSIKDSTINNKKVRVIEVVHAPDDSTRIIEGYEYIYQSGDTIWYWKSDQFHMLYNFSMQKGDSILLYSEMLNQCSENEPYGWNLIDSVFTKTFNGIQLKAYSSIPINNSVWGFQSFSCEIFGNLNYLIPQNRGCISDGIWYGPLRCYSDPVNGVLVTSLPSLKCDSTFTYSGPIDNGPYFFKPGLFSIYPNPVTNELLIDYSNNNNLQGFYELDILNTNGATVISYCCNISNTEVIDVSNLTKGTYFIIISKNKKLLHYEKFIKI